MAFIEKRKRLDGKLSYRVKQQKEGHPPVSKTFAKLSDAKAYQRLLETDVMAGRYGAAHAATKIDCATAINRYVDDILFTKTDILAYAQQQKKQLLWWRTQLEGVHLASLTPFMVNDILVTLAHQGSKRKKPSTINRYYAALRCVITACVEVWGWLEVNPLKTVRPKKEPKGRVRFLSFEELAALYDIAKREVKIPLWLMILFSVCTGARKTEMLTLKRCDVYFARQMCVAYNTKNGEPRQLYMNAQLTAALQQWVDKTKGRGPYVFCDARGKILSLESPWARARRDARIDNFKWHDLRHTTASYIAMSGGSGVDIAEILGHKDLQTAKRYTHLTQTHSFSVTTKASDYLLTAIPTISQGEAACTSPNNLIMDNPCA